MNITKEIAKNPRNIYYQHRNMKIFKFFIWDARLDLNTLSSKPKCHLEMSIKIKTSQCTKQIFIWIQEKFEIRWYFHIVIYIQYAVWCMLHILLHISNSRQLECLVVPWLFPWDIFHLIRIGTIVSSLKSSNLPSEQDLVFILWLEQYGPFFK